MTPRMGDAPERGRVQLGGPGLPFGMFYVSEAVGGASSGAKRQPLGALAPSSGGGDIGEAGGGSRSGGGRGIGPRPSIP